MYREAAAMFLENPVMGVGADRFGELSCIGPGWFPHSTILQAFAELGALGGGLLVGLLAFAAVTQVRPLLSVRSVADWPINAFVLALFATFLVADQIYGNYFMAVGVSLMLGVTASLRAQGLRDGSRG
jgi:O-antigen ligase